MILQEINKEIEKEYETRRRAADRLSQERREEIYKQIPEICVIDRTINTLGILIGYSAMKRRPPVPIAKDLPETYFLMGAEQLNTEIEILQEKKKDILQRSGYPADYMIDVYLCNICHDRGLISVAGTYQNCSCRKKLLADKLKKAAGIFPEDVFEKFDSNLYPAAVDPIKYGISISPKTQMEAVYKRCVRFAEHFTEKNINNMVFVGNSGLGKTFLGNCIMNELTDRGISCLYMPATSLFKPFAPGFYGQESAAELADFIMSCEFLLIDDLGSEKQTGARYGELLEILNTRAMRGRTSLCKTVVTTNLTPANLFSYYGERVASRILGAYDILKFAGEDIRLKQKSAY